MRLLVCDDDESVGRFLGTVLDADEWTVEATASGRDCLARLAGFDPDVIVLDQVMPGLTGIETAGEIRGRGYDGPILLFSAHLTPKIRTEARALGLRTVSKIDTEALVRILTAFESGERPGRPSAASLRGQPGS